MSEKNVDLVYEASIMLSQFGTEHDNENDLAVPTKLKEKFSTIDQEDIKRSVERALQLREAVNTNPFYNEPFATVRETVRQYLVENFSDLSDRCRAFAERRIMFLYIK